MLISILYFLCPLRPLARQGHQLCYADEHRHNLGSLLGHSYKEKCGLPRLSTDSYKPCLPSQWSSPADFLWSLWGKIKIGLLGRVPQCWGLDVLWALVSPSIETIGPGNPSWYGAMLPLEGAVWSECSHSSYPLEGYPFQSLSSQGVLQPHPWVLRFSQNCLVYGYLSVGLVKGASQEWPVSPSWSILS